MVAPSAGIVIEPYKSRFENAVKTFTELGFNIKMCPSVYKMKNFRSNTPKLRAKEFMDMYLDDEVDMIFSVAGGEFMMEILPYINFEKLKKSKPKFFQGNSDNTNLTFTLTTICDIASIYSASFPEFGMKDWYKNICDNYEFLMGNNVELSSFKYCEPFSLKHEPNMQLASYNDIKKTHWKILTKEKQLNLQGRIIGGCLDILTFLCGTKFDKVKEFNNRYKNEKIIWYFESCDLTNPSQIRAIWQLKNAGWFQNVEAFIIGRPLNSDTVFGTNYKQANLLHLKDFKVPVIIDADIGHVAPSIHIVNGAIANISITINEDKTTNVKIKYELK
ncbi:MAG: LD-carboxypeptidase [Clostridia bacterium]|nr:LD-carboxypeptidase [Clostridia bacterium]